VSEGFESIAGAGGTGASVSVTGRVVKSPAKGQAIELLVTGVVVVGGVSDPSVYPLAKKKHTLEYLRDIQHLRPRTNTLGAVTRVRNACANATHAFFQERGFLYIHTPIITAADCEGAGEMFGVTTLMPAAPKGDLPRTKEGAVDWKKDFFARPTMLTVSGQLQVEAFACAMSDVYTFGPTFRAENSHTSRHLAEFWMIEPEIAFATLAEDMALAEDYLKFATQWVLDHCGEDLRFFEETFEKGLCDRLRNVVASPFQKLTYTEAIELLLKPEHVRVYRAPSLFFFVLCARPCVTHALTPYLPPSPSPSPPTVRLPLESSRRRCTGGVT
jgi:asparaginyl-tRNA synthetase